MPSDVEIAELRKRLGLPPPEDEYAELRKRVSQPSSEWTPQPHVSIADNPSIMQGEQRGPLDPLFDTPEFRRAKAESQKSATGQVIEDLGYLGRLTQFGLAKTREWGGLTPAEEISYESMVDNPTGQYSNILKVFGEDKPFDVEDDDWWITKAAKEVGNFGVNLAAEVVTDPTTFLTAGTATAAGKAAQTAKQAGPKFAAGLRAALADGKSAASYIDEVAIANKFSPAFTKRLKDAGEAIAGPELGRSYAEKHARGQVANLKFAGMKVKLPGDDWVASKFNRMPDPFSEEAALRKAALNEQNYKYLRDVHNMETEVAQLGGDPNLIYDAVESKNFNTGTALDPYIKQIAQAQDDLLKQMKAAGLDVSEFASDEIGYMHRVLTPEARKWMEPKKGRFGKAYDTKTGAFIQRSEKFRDMKVHDANALMREEHGIDFDFFNENPFESLLELQHQEGLRIANADFATAMKTNYGKLLDTPEAVAQAIGDGGKSWYEIAGTLRMKRPAGNARKVEKAFDTLKSGKVISAERRAKLEKLVEGKDEVGIRAQAKALNEAKNTVLPQEAAEFLTRAIDLQNNPAEWLKTVDRITSQLKAGTLLPFPAFHARNLAENTLKLMYHGGVAPREIMLTKKLLAENVDMAGAFAESMGDRAANNLSRKMREYGKRMKGDVSLYINGEGLVDGARQAEIMAADGILGHAQTRLGSEVSHIKNAAKQTMVEDILFGRAKGIRQAAMRGLTRVSQATDNFFRAVKWRDMIEKGATREEAAAEVKRIFFDYESLSEAEKKFSKAFFFYNFYRQNQKYLSSELMRRPGLSIQMLKLTQDDPDNELFSKYMQSIAPQNQIRSVLNWLGPQDSNAGWADASKRARTVGKNLNPILKMGIEAISGTDIETGRKLDELTMGKAWMEAFGAEKHTNQDTGEEWYETDPLVNFLLGSMPPLSRAVGMVSTLTDEKRTWANKITKIATGANINPTDPVRKQLDGIRRAINYDARKHQDILKQTAYGRWAIDDTTPKGAFIAALCRPSSERVDSLVYDMDVHAQVLPYVGRNRQTKGASLRKTGRELLLKIAQKRYPEIVAILDWEDGLAKMKSGLKKTPAEQLQDFLNPEPAYEG